MTFDLARFTSTLRTITELESPSFNKAAVDRCGVAIRRQFEMLGGKTSVHHQNRFGDHLRIDFDGQRDGTPVLLLGHFDTVWELGTLAKMPVKTEKGRVWGPGVYDMKGGIVLMLEAIRRLQQQHGGLPRPITVWLVTDEEVGSDSSRAMTETIAKQCAAVLVLEPSRLDGALKTARKGVGEFVVKITGVSSHAGVDFGKGHSAVLEASRQILKIARFTDLKRGLTVNPGVVQGGTRTNVIPDHAEIQCDVRIARMKDATSIEKKFRGLKPVDRKCKLGVEGGINRPPMERTKGVATLFTLASRIAREHGYKLKEFATGGGSDGNFTAGLGIPTLDGLGCAGEGAHALHESIVIDQLEPRVALLAGLLEAIPAGD